MKKDNLKIIILPAVFVILLIVVAVGYFWWNENSSAVDLKNSNQKEVLILKGRGASQIGQLLHEEGLIKNALAFKLYVSITGKAKDLQAGEFSVSPSNNLKEVVAILTGPPAELWVTIPEGLRKEEMVVKFVDALKMDKDESKVFQEDFISETRGKEGYLFPDTYLLPHDVTADVAAGLMQSTFESKTKKIKATTQPDDLTFDEVVVLASLIEREAKSDDERPVIAGILINRLNIAMALQVDASVQYAVASNSCNSLVDCNWWPILTKDDLQINSPFNTYKYPGLPPAPIANPGLASIEAANDPQDTEYFYYIHDAEGDIHYARTLQEHNENIRLYLNN